MMVPTRRNRGATNDGSPRFPGEWMSFRTSSGRACRGWPAAAALPCLIAFALPARAQETGPAAPATVAGAASAPTRETAREFLDSLADNALTPDPNQIYRQRGARREIGLGRGWTAWLDEMPPSRIDSGVPIPGVASAPSRVLGLAWRRPGWFGDIGYARTSVARDAGGSLRWELLDGWALHADLREQRSSLTEIDARRRDSALALRWQALPDAWLEAGVHRASLESVTGDPVSTTPEGAENFWRARAQWRPSALPGLNLGVGAERSIARPASALGAGRLEFGADYTLQPDNAFGPALAGTRLLWREAPRLGLLSEGQALDARAAFHRTLGIEVPDGSRDGAVYAQWRQRSVASDDDTLAVIGWRHRWDRRGRWDLRSHVEQAFPVAGPNTVRSFTVGGRIARGNFPDNTFVTDFELVNSDRDDSLYTAIKYTFRLDEAWLSAWRASATRTQPHGQSEVGTTAYKLSAALGWREPVDKRLSALGRWTFVGTETNEAGSTDRRAHIALAGTNYVFDDNDDGTLRWTRRWERDELRPEFRPRVSTMAMARWVHQFDERWSLSGHIARRNDAIDGKAKGFGAEAGYKLSRKAVLAIGYNPRGFKDHELEVDERLAKGLTLRLRFSIDAALGRWLDAPSAQK